MFVIAHGRVRPQARIHPGFETEGRRYQKTKTGISMTPQKGLTSSINLKIKESL